MIVGRGKSIVSAIAVTVAAAVVVAVVTVASGLGSREKNIYHASHALSGGAASSDPVTSPP